jgi:hypothetical protein
MKKTLLVFILNFQFFIIISFAQSPNWLWANGFGGASISTQDVGGSIASDAVGNTYTSGHFGGTIDFDPGPGVYNLTAANTSDDFILKLDSAGNFLWVRTLGFFNFNSIHCIVVDDSGSVYSVGTFTGTVDFDPGVGVFDLTAAGNGEVYVWKLDSSGNFIWAKVFGGTFSNGYILTLDSSANVYVGGTFRGTSDFDPDVGIFNLTATGPDAAFISKLDSAGNFIWAKAIDGTNHSDPRSIAINPAASADIYFAGSFSGTTDFDPDTGMFNLTSSGCPGL